MANIRFANEHDAWNLMALGRDMHAESPRFRKHAFLGEKAMRLVFTLLDNPCSILLVAEQDGKLIGMMVGGVTEHFFSDAKHAFELVLYVEPTHRGGTTAVRLVKAFEVRARELGASEFAPGVSTEVEAERTTKLYEHLGYRRSGFILLKDLQHV